MLWKSYAGPALLLVAVLLLLWNLMKPKSPGLPGFIALLCAVLSGLAFGLSYIYVLTDDLQFLMRTMSESAIIREGLVLLLAHIFGFVLPLACLLILIFLIFSFSKSHKHPALGFSALAFVVLLLTGILTMTGHLGMFAA
jgi:hypothetical protein